MTQVSFPHLVIARIPEYVEPIERGDRYEDPLNAELEERNIGRVTGGGTQLDEDFKIQFVDVEIELADLDESLSATIEVLDKLGCPFGSELLFERDGVMQSRPFGELESLEIYFDGINLPQEVYETSDFDSIYEQLSDALADANAGETRGIWCGPEETAIFTFGPSADAIYKIVERLYPQIPLFQNARLVFKRRGDAGRPTEKRLPMYG